jgi:hypothetical protein
MCTLVCEALFSLVELPIAIDVDALQDTKAKFGKP